MSDKDRTDTVALIAPRTQTYTRPVTFFIRVFFLLIKEIFKLNRNVCVCFK